MDDIKNILVLSRSTTQCKKAVNYDLSLAEKNNAALYILHVFHNPFGLEGWNIPIVSITELEKEYKRMQQNARDDIDEMVASKKAAGVQVEAIFKEGDPDKELFRTIKEHNIDLLILAAHSEWRMEHFLFGRSNNEIIRKLPCSVMMVKSEPY